jgi:hypothetical protein
MKITSDLTNLTTAILILTVQMFIEWTLLFYNDNDLFLFKQRVNVYFSYLWNFRVFSEQTPLGRPLTSFPTTQTLCKCPCFSLLLCFKVASRLHQC